MILGVGGPLRPWKPQPPKPFVPPPPLTSKPGAGIADARTIAARMDHWWPVHALLRDSEKR